MKKTITRILLLNCFGLTGLAQKPSVEYEISFPRVAHHEARVEATFRDVPAGPLEIRMSRSSPGRYALHEFVKNVYGFEAFDSRGNSLPTTRPDPYGWTVAGHDGNVRISYILFADRADGTYSAIDRTHAHLNIPATFAWARGMDEAPIRIRFNRPDARWKISTQLPPSGEPDTFLAPDLSYFMDSPVEISPQQIIEWPVKTGRRAFKARLSIHHTGTEAEAEAFARMLHPILSEAREIFGEFPSFDHEEYSFIMCLLPEAFDDGMEHRNSTIITSSVPLREDVIDPAVTAAHEFFHAWNVERIRPRSLEPFNLEGANISRELWFAEGFTSYYAPLIMIRSRLISIDAYLERLSRILDEVIRAPGRAFGSPEEMSQRATLADRASFQDPVNHENTFVSYYPYGAAIALALDLSLQNRTPPSSLDSFMREVWLEYGKEEIRYTQEDLERTLAHTCGDEDFAREFFSRYVRGRELPDFQELLATAGLQMRTKHPGKPYLGRSEIRSEATGVVVDSPTRIGEPLYDAGLSQGDLILRIGDSEIKDGSDIERLLSNCDPGQVLRIEFVSRGERIDSEIRLAEDPALEIVAAENHGGVLSESQVSRRRDWLGSKSPSSEPLHRHCPKCGRDYPFEQEYCGYDGEKLQIHP